MTNSNWILDKSKSNIRFKVKHLLVANIQGEFHDFDIDIENNGEEFVAAVFKLRIRSASVNTRLKQRDDHLKSVDFLHVEEHPEIVFESSEVNEVKVNQYHMKGNLTIKEITKSFNFYVNFTESADQDTLGDFTLEATINRGDFGLNWNAFLSEKWPIVDESIKLYGNIRLLEKTPGDRVKGLAGRSDVTGNKNYQLFSTRQGNENGTFSWSQVKDSKVHWVFGITTGDTEETHFRALKTKLYIESLVKEYEQVNNPSQFLRILHFALQEDTFLTRSIYDNNTFSLDSAYLVIDRDEGKIRYCSARLSMVLLKPGGLKLFPSNHISLGFPYYNVGQLVDHTIPFEPGDTLVVFNEELVKQSGGKHGKKLGKKTVGSILNDNRQQPWDSRAKHFQKILHQWAGELPIGQILIAQIKL